MPLRLVNNLLLQAEIEQAIENLGKGTESAGPCGLLRVFISHPTLPNDDALDGAVKGSHPVPTVPLDYLHSLNLTSVKASCH